MIRALVAFFAVLVVSSPAASQIPVHHATPVPSYPGTLPFFYDFYTFRGEDGGTLVVAAFAVPAGELEPKEIEESLLYRFDVSLVLADTALRSVSRSDDSASVATSRPLSDQHLLFTHIALQAAPSRNTVQRVVMTDASTPGMGQLYDSAFPIPDYSGSDLMLSDIALGQPEAEGGWQRGDARVTFLPIGRIPESAFEVYYEIYNLPYLHRYVTEIAVERVGGGHLRRVGDGGKVGLRFADMAYTPPDGVLQELRRVNAALGEGRYRLTVTVTDQETGEQARRSRLFEVRRWGPGATLVVSLPRSAPGLR